MTIIYYELKGCKEGETNQLTKELWCKLRGEFCKYLKICPLGYKREKR